MRNSTAKHKEGYFIYVYKIALLYIGYKLVNFVTQFLSNFSLTSKLRRCGPLPGHIGSRGTQYLPCLPPPHYMALRTR